MSDSAKWMVMGVLTVILGVVVLGNTAIASVAVTWLAGLMFLIGGGLQVVGGFSVEEMWGKAFAWIMGAIMLMIGWSLLSHPLQGVISLTVALLIIVFVGGVVRIVVSMRMRGTAMFMPMLISGVLSILLAGLIWSRAGESPEILFNFLGLLMGIEMLLDGLGLIFLGLFSRGQSKTA